MTVAGRRVALYVSPEDCRLLSLALELAGQKGRLYQDIRNALADLRQCAHVEQGERCDNEPEDGLDVCARHREDGSDPFAEIYSGEGVWDYED